MNGRSFVPLLSLVAVACLIPSPSAGQGSSTEPATAPTTAWGDPDLQGVWTGSTLTPLERPADLAGKAFLTEEEAAEREEIVDRNRFTERVPRDGDPGTYNQIWFDPGTRIVADRRTALLVMYWKETPGFWEITLIQM